MADTRPDWPFKEMTEADFRKVKEFGLIVSVKAEWKFTSEDTADSWLTATRDGGKSIRLPASWEQGFKFVGRSSSPGLFDLTYLGERMKDRIDEIDAWEKANAKDRREFERLKAKFSQSQ